MGSDEKRNSDKTGYEQEYGLIDLPIDKALTHVPEESILETSSLLHAVDQMAPPLLGVRISGDHNWVTEGTISTLNGDFEIYSRPEDVDPQVLYWPVGDTLHTEHVVALNDQRGTIDIQGKPYLGPGFHQNPGILVQEGDTASASIDALHGVEYSSVVDRLANLMGSPAGVVNAEATTVSTADNELTVYVRAQAEAPESELYQLEYVPDSGTLTQRPLIGNPHFAGHQSMRPATITEYDMPDAHESNANTGRAYGDSERPNPNLSQIGSPHPAGYAHTSVGMGTDIPNDGNARPQGDRTHEPVTSNYQGPKLASGQGEHPAGAAHSSDSLTATVGDAAVKGGAVALGGLLNRAADPDGVLETATWSTFQQNLNETVSGNGGFGDTTEDFGSNLQSAAAGVVAGELAGEVTDSLGFDGNGLGDQLGARLTTQAASMGANAGAQTLTSGVETGAASFNQSFTAANFAKAGAGVVGTYAANELGFGAETQAGATMGSVGSTIGTYVGSVFGPMGAAVGSFIGSALGSAIGDLFGSDDPPPPPEAQATLTADESGHFSVGAASDVYGGNAGGMAVAAQRAADTLNTLVDKTGGRILEPEALGDIEIGYDGDGVYAGGERLDTIPDAVSHLVENSLTGTAIEGGDVYIKRAVYRQLEDGFDPAEMRDAIDTAEQYSETQRPQGRIDALAESPAVEQELARYRAGEIGKDDLSDSAAAVLEARNVAQRAEELGLDRSHRFDDASRLNDAFEGRGIDLGGVSVTDLIISNVHGELIVAVADSDRPDAAIRDLPHATVKADAGDFGAAMLYLPDGGSWQLQSLLDLADVRPGGGAVHVGDALQEQYADGGEVLRMGSTDHDAVEGGSQDEALIGLQGADILRGAAGSDRLVGGAGYDTLEGGTGEDTADYRDSFAAVAVDLDVGQGHGGTAHGDTLNSIENVEGSAHNDRLRGDAETNALRGHEGDDFLSGGGGDDALYGETGDDALGGGAGSDRLAGHAGDDALSGGRGADRVAGGEGDDRIAGGTGGDFLMGGSGDDVLDGGAGRDFVAGGAGNDLLHGRGDGDTLAGGVGADTAVYQHAMADYRIDVVDGELRITDPSSDGEGDRLIGIETLQFGDRIVSTEQVKEYLAIIGEAEDEQRERRTNGVTPASTTAIGDAAAIGLVAAFATPAIAAQQEVAALQPGQDALAGNRSEGASAPATALGEFPADPGVVERAADGAPQAVTDGAQGGLTEAGAVGRSTGSSGIGDEPPAPAAPGAADPREPFTDRSLPPEPTENDRPDESDEEVVAMNEAESHSEDEYYLRGTAGDDVLVDELGLNKVFAGSGNDRIIALDGDDRIDAGSGNDIIRPGPGADDVIGGEGLDVVEYRNAEAGVGVDLLHGVGTDGIALGDSYDGIEGVVGSQNADWLRAANNPTSLLGLGGDDQLIGGGKGDSLRGGEGADILMGAGGADTLIGGDGADVYMAGAGDDRLYVDADDDLGFVAGGAGTDTVTPIGAFATVVDLSMLDSVEIAQGTAADDDWIGAYDFERISGGAGYDTVSFTQGVRDIVIDWPDLERALNVSYGDENTVDIYTDTEELHFSDRTLYLDGRGNAPIVAGETLSGREDTRLHFDDADLTANDFEIDPGDSVRLQSVAGIDVALTRAIESAYWNGAGPGARETAAFSGRRDEYAIRADGDHLDVEHLAGGADGTDRLSGIQTLRFADTNVHIGEADVRRGEVQVSESGFSFRSSHNYNNLSDGTQAGFNYTVAGSDGLGQSAAAEIDVNPVNDRPYLGAGKVDFDGELTSAYFDPDPEDDDSHDRHYWQVNSSGQVLGRDHEDGDNLTYRLVRDTDHGRVDLDPDGSFTYRLNVGRDDVFYGTEEIQRCSGYGVFRDCETTVRETVTPPADLISKNEAQFASFRVEITDHGERPGVDDDRSVRRNIQIESNTPGGGDDDCFPVALDLGDDGMDFRSIDDSDIIADVNGDGMTEKMAWIGEEDGLLMFDRDGDDQFSRPDEISFVNDHPDAATDMEGLELAFDTNHDGNLDATDERWTNFHVWQDADGDGISDPGELQTMAEAGIDSIGVVSDQQFHDRSDGGVTVFGHSQYTRSDGSTGAAADVALATSVVATASSSDMDSPPLTSDEVANMFVQQLAQSRAASVAPSSDTTGVASVPVEVPVAMQDAEEQNMAMIAG